MRRSFALIVAAAVTTAACLSLPSPRQAVTTGTPIVLVADQEPITDLVLDSTHAYWIAAALYRRALTGGAVEELDRSRISQHIAVDASGVYAADASSVYRVALSGSTPVVLDSDVGSTNNLALDATAVYYAVSDTMVRATPKDGSAASIVFQDTTAYLRRVAVANGSVYYQYAQDIQSRVIGQTTVAVYSSASTAPLDYTSIAVDNIGVTWVTATGEVAYYRFADSTAVRYHMGAADAASAVTMDAQQIYFVARATGTGRILRVSRTDGAESVVAADQVEAAYVAVNDTNLCWAARQQNGKSAVICVTISK